MRRHGPHADYHDAYANFLALAFMPSLPGLMLLAASTAASLFYRLVWRFRH